jgi:CRISP-associated protein Cas1
MGRPRCDPIDVNEVLDALSRGRTTPFQAYREYASTAARPYARESWEGILKQARQSGQDCPHGVLAVTPLGQAQRELDPASLDAASDAYWEQFLRIKSRVLTTVHDNASLRVKGGALVVCDGDYRLVYEASARKPHAIVMAGWSGMVTIEAVRWACDHKVAIVLLDWMRDFLTIVAPPAKTNAALIRAQVLADPLTAARSIVAAKVNAHIRVGAIPQAQGEHFIEQVHAAHSVREVMVQEAQAARMVWRKPAMEPPAIVWRSGSPRIPTMWKLPYSTRKRASAPSPRKAVHPVNSLLNLAFSITAGRLAAYLAARGFAPSIGFLHSDKPGRWSLAYDVIEPLRPLIERSVFGFIGRYQFGSNDFIRANDGSIRLADNLLRVVIADTALSGRILDAAVDWVIRLIRAACPSAGSGPTIGAPCDGSFLFKPLFPLSDSGLQAFMKDRGGSLTGSAP